jgi:hypothetical protein
VVRNVSLVNVLCDQSQSLGICNAEKSKHFSPTDEKLINIYGIHYPSGKANIFLTALRRTNGTTSAQLSDFHNVYSTSGLDSTAEHQSCEGLSLEHCDQPARCVHNGHC